MVFLENLLRILDAQMDTPAPYGWFHLLFVMLTAVSTVYLCAYRKQDPPHRVKAVVFGVAIVVAVLEVYKQINYSFTPTDNGIVFDFQWYAFPWQFCSTPMYVGLLAGLTRKGKLHDALCAYLATYAVFAGLCVMLYPLTVFTGTIGINIQTMICHGTMIPVGAYLLTTGYVKLEHKTILKAIPVFAATVLIAIILNEIAYYSGLLQTDTFNMFFISPYCEPSLPVYSLVQNAVPYPFSLILYIWGFSTAAYLMLLIPIAILAIAAGIANQCVS